MQQGIDIRVLGSTPVEGALDKVLTLRKADPTTLLPTDTEEVTTLGEVLRDMTISPHQATNAKRYAFLPTGRRNSQRN